MQPHCAIRPLSPILLLAAAVLAPASAEVRLPALLSDHAVLAREGPVNVWGWADAGEAVAVEIAGQRAETRAAADGRWRVQFAQLTAPGPQTLRVSGRNELVVRDVVGGEVWLASGQSNMAMTVAQARDFPAEQAAAHWPALRIFTVAPTHAETPREDCQGRWIPVQPETVGAFSAVAYFFGRDLHRLLQVPVGLIVASWGASPIQAWTSRAAQEGDPALAPVLARKFSTSIPSASDPTGSNDPKNFPGVLFNGMIAPLLPYAIRGALWYQGENSTRDVEYARLYGRQLRTLIGDWRTRWGLGDFPFAWVQLPNFSGKDRPGWVLVREQMLGALDVAHTGMAVTVDVGDPKNLHPVNKQPVGERLAAWALGTIYGRPGAISGPLFAASEPRPGELVVRFRPGAGRLTVQSGGTLRGFEVAGADRRWHEAAARLAGETVVVSSAAVSAPVAVRYAWRPNPDGNLANDAGFPASPFRSQEWE